MRHASIFRIVVWLISISANAGCKDVARFPRHDKDMTVSEEVRDAKGFFDSNLRDFHQSNWI